MVATSNHPQTSIDFHKTFSPVVLPTTIRHVLSIDLTNEWPIRQLDVKNSFHHGILTEQVYMRPPPGFIDPDFQNTCVISRKLYMVLNKNLVVGFIGLVVFLLPMVFHEVKLIHPCSPCNSFPIQLFFSCMLTTLF